MLVSEFRRRIRDREYTPNAPLTVAFKKSDNPTPLVDSGKLFKSLEWKKVQRGAYLAGVMHGSFNERGYELSKLAEDLHDGVSFAVSPKMRLLFEHLSLYSQGEIDIRYLTGRAIALSQRLRRGTIIPELSQSKQFIHIPRRPFITDPFEDQVVRSKIIANWRWGYDRVFTVMGKQSKKAGR
jgi:hypothetical protein